MISIGEKKNLGAILLEIFAVAMEFSKGEKEMCDFYGILILIATTHICCIYNKAFSGIL